MVDVNTEQVEKLIFGKTNESQAEAADSTKNEEVEMAVHKCLHMKEPSYYCDGILEVIPRWIKCINMFWNCFKE